MLVRLLQLREIVRFGTCMLVINKTDQRRISRKDLKRLKEIGAVNHYPLIARFFGVRLTRRWRAIPGTQNIVDPEGWLRAFIGKTTVYVDEMTIGTVRVILRTRIVLPGSGIVESQARYTGDEPNYATLGSYELSDWQLKELVAQRVAYDWEDPTVLWDYSDELIRDMLATPM
jgi:hypothetical protein